MADQGTGEVVAEDAEVVIARWQGQVQALVVDVRGWAEGAGWRTRTIRKTVTDHLLGKYQIEGLLMERDMVEVALNPVMPLATGAQGVVDLDEVPAYDDIARLYLDDLGQWSIPHFAYIEALGVKSTLGQVPADLHRETFLDVLAAVTSHAA